jgi:hypothetical protein
MSEARRSTVTWVVLIGALAALVLVGATYGRRKQAEAMHHLFFAETALPAVSLQACLGQGLPLAGGWKESAGHHQQAWDATKHLLVDVADQGAHRRVELSSLGGQPLDGQQNEALRRCLAAG